MHEKTVAPHTYGPSGLKLFILPATPNRDEMDYSQYQATYMQIGLGTVTAAQIHSFSADIEARGPGAYTQGVLIMPAGRSLTKRGVVIRGRRAMQRYEAAHY